MKITFWAAGALAVALAMPLGAYAQQSQPQGVRAQHTTPSQAKLQHRWMKRLGNLNLSSDQQQRIQSMIGQYSQAHPQGSPGDREASRDLRRQILSVLSSDQQNQYREQMRAPRAATASRTDAAAGRTTGSRPARPGWPAVPGWSARPRWPATGWSAGSGPAGSAGSGTAAEPGAAARSRATAGIACAHPRLLVRETQLR